jgi:hypothetical protein
MSLPDRSRPAICPISPTALALLALAGLAIPLGHAGAANPPSAQFKGAAAAARPLPEASSLHLRTGEVDVSRSIGHPGGPPPLHTQIGAHPAGERFVVQLDGPMTPERRQRLQNAGIVAGPYLPPNAFIVTLDNANPAAVAGLEFIRWHSVYRDEWKIDPDVGTRPYRSEERQQLIARGRDHLLAVVFPGADVGAVEQAIWAIPGAQILAIEDPAAARALNAAGLDAPGASLPLSTEIYIEMNLGDVGALAQVRGVQYIEPASEIDARAAAAAARRNDQSRWTIQSNLPGVFPLYNAGLRGEGQIVGILDTAIRQDHCSFNDPGVPIGPSHRKIVAYNTSPGSASHGTHVAGSIVGDAGQNTGNTRGIAYMGRLAYNSWGTSPFSDIMTRLTTHHAQGARVHSNSWGDDGTTAYNALCRNIDLFQWENEDSLTLWAVTNTSTLKNPENAKNTLAVGATQIAPNQHQHGYGGTGPTSDGRRKPEVYAPGRDTTSASSSTTCGTTSMGGTSMACPVTAGGGMLIRQYFMDGYYPVGVQVPGSGFTPSAALVKAMLVNSAVDMTGVSGYPTNQEGWGRIHLDRAVYFQGDPRKLRIQDVRNGDGLNTGQFVEYPLPVIGSGQQLSVTVAWTEPPATAGASLAVVNDLDLEVVDPIGQVYLGNVFNTTGGFSILGGTRDDRNNVEQVHIPAPAAGLWTVRIRGRAINQSAQGYAVVMSGDIVPAQPPALILLLGSPVPTLIEPDTPRELSVRILEGSQTLEPGSARLHYRSGATGAFDSVPLAHVSGDLYAANLPGQVCSAEPQFYFSALTDQSTTVTLPENAPEYFFSTKSGVIVTEPLLETGFASAWPPGWSATGLWNVTNSCLPPGGPAIACAQGPFAYFGRITTCNYNLPTGPSSGALTAPVLSLPVIPPVSTGARITLRFCYALETEESPTLDKAELFVNGTTRPAWRLPDVRPAAGQPDRYWATAEFDLSEFAGQDVTLSWRFNTVNASNNTFRGWHMTNVVVEAGVVGCEGPAACYANCDGSTSHPVLNVDDFTCFINAFALAQTLPAAQQIEHYANCDESTTTPVLNVDDFTCFINAFALGCP